MNRLTSLALLVVTGVSMSEAAERTFAEDVAYLKKYVKTIVLKGEGGAAVAVVPGYQCRVMTSAADAAKGEGFGWINYPMVSSKKKVPHITVYGGEDRFWMGPEGGQFSIFFKDFSPFDLEHWQTPAPIDTDAYKVIEQTETSVTCGHTFDLVNYSGTKFKVKLTRTVQVLSANQAMKSLGLSSIGTTKMVGFQSINTVENKGNRAWTEMDGKLSIWILGMYKPSDQTTIIVPFDTNGDGNIVNDTYFGKVPPERLKVDGDLVLFRGDGKMRNKIGMPPTRAKDVLGSYDASRNLLTIVKFTHDKDATQYVNSMWELQDKPFGGDVSNSYNDGPPKPGAKPLGPFYEIESSSPAMGLAPRASHTHVSETYHFTGSRAELNAISQKVLGADLDKVAATFK